MRHIEEIPRRLPLFQAVPLGRCSCFLSAAIDGIGIAAGARGAVLLLLLLSPEYLVDLILDAAGNKGTGKWTVQQAAEWAVPVPCLAAALDMR